MVDGRLVDFAAHLARLDRSLSEIALAPRSATRSCGRCMRSSSRGTVSRKAGSISRSRGRGRPRFPLPRECRADSGRLPPKPARDGQPYAATGVKVVTIPDLRWKRRDIKSTSMLAQVMGKQAAKLKGAYEAWMVEDGFVTEGTSSSAFIVDNEGVVRTQPLGHHILPGVTRRAVLRLAATQGVSIEERPFSVARSFARAKPSSPPPRPSCCRSWRSTGSRSATGAQARSCARSAPLYRGGAEIRYPR